MGKSRDIVMAVYHQMGHQSDNLLTEPYLSNFQGAILSPVNYTEQELSRTLEICRELDKFETIFDPQLYYPQTQREKLKEWSYFPADVDTVDLTSLEWWENLIKSLASTLIIVRPDVVCSPALAPRNFDNEYFHLMSEVSSMLCDVICPIGIDVLQTVFVNTSELASYERVMSIASIITRTSARGIYLILFSDSRPRLELSDPEELKGALQLINVLETNGTSVLVGYSSSDIVLWKVAGASACASGKFFNLRRFTPSRWDDSDAGGGQMAYWFEESLMAYIRESDISRVNRAGLVSKRSRNNPFAEQILHNIKQGKPWLGLSWRFFLYWFSDIESQISDSNISPIKLVRDSDENWGTIEDEDIILEERRNDGRWIRQWLRALTEFSRPW